MIPRFLVHFCFALKKKRLTTPPLQRFTSRINAKLLPLTKLQLTDFCITIIFVYVSYKLKLELSYQVKNLIGIRESKQIRDFNFAKSNILFHQKTFQKI